MSHDLPPDSVHIGAGALVRVRPGRGYVLKCYRDVPWRSAQQCRHSTIWALRLLSSSRHVARILRITRHCIVTSYCGQQLCRANAPADLGAQAETLLVELAAADILHRDIVPGNLMVHDGVLKLIDFAWATRLSEPEPIPPDAPHLGGHWSLGGNDTFDDRHSLFGILGGI